MLLDVFLMVLLCLHNALTVEYHRTLLLGDWFPSKGTSRLRRFPSVCDCLSMLACVLTCLNRTHLKQAADTKKEDFSEHG